MKKRLVSFLLALTALLSLAGGAQALTDLSVYAEARFSHGMACYSGPGSYYYRANNGKATYGGGGVARVYGVTGDWIMIGYGFYKDGVNQYRIGYIEKSALNQMSDVHGSINYSLSFSSTPVWAARACSLTDDPVINNTSILSIPQNTAMTALGTMGTEWTYVEVMGVSSRMRGFVRSDCLTYSNPGTGAGGPVTGNTGPAAANPPQNAPNTYYHLPNKGVYLPDYQVVRFPGSAAVYSGPGTNYYRAANGKALMGGGECRLYGVENGWALIGYELSSGSYRIGYVELSKTPQLGLGIPYLDLQYTPMTVQYDVSLTDDIVIYYPTVLTLSRGAQVTFLGLCQGTSGVWAYVEVAGLTSPMRGFIPAAALGY